MYDVFLVIEEYKMRALLLRKKNSKGLWLRLEELKKKTIFHVDESKFHKKKKKNRFGSLCYRRTHLNIKWMCGKCARTYCVCNGEYIPWITLILFNRFSIHQLNCCYCYLRPEVGSHFFLRNENNFKKFHPIHRIEFRLNGHLTIPDTYSP